MNKYIRLILKASSYLIVTIAVLLAFFLAGIKLFNVQIYTVLSGSMEPNYHVGSLIYVKEINTKELKKGDVITFKLGGNTLATHRITEIVKEENKAYKFRTKGDANESEDAKLVEPKEVIGKVMFTIPLLGYVSTYIQRPPGSFIAISISLLALVYVFIIDSITDNNKKKKQPQDKSGGTKWKRKY